MRRLVYIFVLMAFAVSCQVDSTPLYDNPFVYLATGEGAGSVIVGADADVVNTYYMMLSSKSFDEDIVVEYEAVAGSGLQEGVDYSIITEGRSIRFLPGIFRMPIRIKWMPNEVGADKDNTLRLRITHSNVPLTYGLPGPDACNRELVITKRNL